MLIAMNSKFVKIEIVLPTEGGKHFFEGDMFDLHFRDKVLNIDEHRNCAPHRGRGALL